MQLTKKIIKFLAVAIPKSAILLPDQNEEHRITIKCATILTAKRLWVFILTQRFILAYLI